MEDSAVTERIMKAMNNLTEIADCFELLISYEDEDGDIRVGRYGFGNWLMRQGMIQQAMRDEDSERITSYVVEELCDGED